MISLRCIFLGTLCAQKKNKNGGQKKGLLHCAPFHSETKINKTMGILQILAHAGLTVKERSNWVAVFDMRPEFRDAFDTNRVGKVKGACFYITPRRLAMPAGLLIKGLGYELLHLPSTNGASEALYPGFDTTGVSDGELTAFVMHLREAIDNRVATEA